MLGTESITEGAEDVGRVPVLQRKHGSALWKMHSLHTLKLHELENLVVIQ